MEGGEGRRRRRRRQGAGWGAAQGGLWCTSVPHSRWQTMTLPSQLDPQPTHPPAPAQVVASAARCVRPDGMFCSFSPCVEQVQRTAEALNANGFRDIRTMEVLLRQHEVSRQSLITDLDAPPAPPGGAGTRQQRRWEGGGGGGRGAKRQKTADGAAAAVEGAAGGEAAAAAADGDAAEAEAEADRQEPAVQQQQQARPAAPQRQVVSKPVPFGRGHTGYLTFARRVVAG